MADCDAIYLVSILDLCRSLLSASAHAAVICVEETEEECCFPPMYSYLQTDKDSCRVLDVAEKDG